jgi:ATP-dependent Lon protease
VRSRADAWGIPEQFFAEHEIHVHVPAGAIPKDGPSAGVAVAIALASLLRAEQVDGGVAMTGEITLTGRVLPVGGVREKLLAAQRAGVRTIILPAANMKDLDDLPAKVRRKLDIRPVGTADEALALALPGLRDDAARAAAAGSEIPTARRPV